MNRAKIFVIISSLLAIWVVIPFWLPLLIGLGLAYLTEPVLKFINKKKRIENQYLLVFILIILFSLLIILPFSLVIYKSLLDFIGLLNKLANDYHLISLTELSTVRGSIASFIYEKLKIYGFNLSIETIITNINSSTSFLILKISEILKNILMNTPSFLLNIVLVLLSWGFLAIESKKIRTIILPIILPWEKERDIIVKTFNNVFKALILASFLIALIQAILATIILGFTGIPSFLALGFLAFFASFIPVVGTGLIMISSSIWLFFNDKPIASILLIIASFLLGFVDNLLRPLFMKNSINLNVFWLFIAFIGGVSAFGLIGAIIGPFFFALLVELIKNYQQEIRDN